MKANRFFLSFVLTLRVPWKSMRYQDIFFHVEVIRLLYGLFFSDHTFPSTCMSILLSYHQIVILSPQSTFNEFCFYSRFLILLLLQLYVSEYDGLKNHHISLQDAMDSYAIKFKNWSSVDKILSSASFCVTESITDIRCMYSMLQFDWSMKQSMLSQRRVVSAN